jgi:hypothetical protein
MRDLGYNTLTAMLVFGFVLAAAKLAFTGSL